jgi:hypothetical protein
MSVIVPNDQLGAYEGEIVARVKPVAYVPADGDFNIGQGGCTDGKYFYIVLENQKVEAEGGYGQNSHYGKIYKLDAKTLDLVQVSDPLPIDHGNDMTYNCKKGLLVVSHNAPNYTYLSYVDPATLQIVETVKDNQLKMYAVDYYPAADRYVVGISYGYDLGILDGELGFVARYPGVNTGFIKQGIACDDNYLYFLQFRKNCVVLYDWDGKYLRTIDIEGNEEEPEAMFCLDGKWYMNSYVAHHQGSRLYEMEFVAE